MMPLLVLAILYINPLNSQFQPNPIESASITPSDTNSAIDKAGISIQLVNGFTQDNEWILSPTDHVGFDMKISFDNSWGFRPTSINNPNSYFNITINNNPHNTTADDFIMALSINDSNYINTIISLNNDHDNIVYPSCRQGKGQQIAQGNINSIMTQSSQTRFAKSTNFQNITQEMYMKDQSQLNRTSSNKWPLQFSWNWYPLLGDFIFRKLYGNTGDGYLQTCYFVQFDDNWWSTNNGFDLFLAVGNVGQTIAITSIDINYKYDLTYSPATQATSYPSLGPTIPTKIPTMTPTLPHKEIMTTVYKYPNDMIENVTTSQSGLDMNILFLVIGVMGTMIVGLCLYIIRTKRRRQTLELEANTSQTIDVARVSVETKSTTNKRSHIKTHTMDKVNSASEVDNGIDGIPNIEYKDQDVLVMVNETHSGYEKVTDGIVICEFKTMGHNYDESQDLAIEIKQHHGSQGIVTSYVKHEGDQDVVDIVDETRKGIAKHMIDKVVVRDVDKTLHYQEDFNIETGTDGEQWDSAK